MPHATIVGGSIGGLFAGTYLRAIGWEVDILERARNDLASRGTGIARHLELEELIAKAGVTATDAVGIFVNGRDGFDENGNNFGCHEFRQQLGAWNRVFQPMFDAFPRDNYHSGSEFSRFTRSSDTVEIETGDGRTFKSDLLIGADGFLSAIRASVAPDITPHYAGYVAWRGVSHEQDLSNDFQTEIFHRYAFLFPRFGQLIGYPMAGEQGTTAPGKRRYNYLWYAPLSEADLTDLLTDADGKTHNYSIPPPLLRDTHVTGLKKLAERYLPPLFREAVFKAHATMVQPIYDVDSNQIAFDRVALIGDAAFVVRPHVGTGVLKAAEDAYVLSQCLKGATDINAALNAFESERLPAAKNAVRHGRRLGAFIEQLCEIPEDLPENDLDRERVLRVSGRPFEHIVSYDLW